MAPTISVSEPQYTWQWQSSRGNILAGALDELHQVCFRDTKKLYSSITVVSSSWSHLQVRALQHGWSIIIWATAGPAGRAEPRPWELWEKKLCLARSYTGGRCHTPYEDFGIGFPGSKKKKSGYSQMAGKETGTLSDSLSEIQWEWLHWELDQALISGCK